jgi:hypothetical protein
MKRIFKILNNNTYLTEEVFKKTLKNLTFQQFLDFPMPDDLYHYNNDKKYFQKFKEIMQLGTSQFNKKRNELKKYVPFEVSFNNIIDLYWSKMNKEEENLLEKEQIESHHQIKIQELDDNYQVINNFAEDSFFNLATFINPEFSDKSEKIYFKYFMVRDNSKTVKYITTEVEHTYYIKIGKKIKPELYLTKKPPLWMMKANEGIEERWYGKMNRIDTAFKKQLNDKALININLSDADKKIYEDLRIKRPQDLILTDEQNKIVSVFLKGFHQEVTPPDETIIELEPDTKLYHFPLKDEYQYLVNKN